MHMERGRWCAKEWKWAQKYQFVKVWHSISWLEQLAFVILMGLFAVIVQSSGIVIKVYS